MSYALVVVDMQTGYATSGCTDTMVEVTRLIVTAIHDKAEIIFLEYCGSGRTQKELLRLVKNYERATVLKKRHPDGSEQVVKHLESKNLKPSLFNVCGVYTTCCVKYTVMGLLDRTKAKVQVFKRGCDDSRRASSWRYYPKKNKKLKLVY